MLLSVSEPRRHCLLLENPSHLIKGTSSCVCCPCPRSMARLLFQLLIKPALVHTVCDNSDIGQQTLHRILRRTHLSSSSILQSLLFESIFLFASAIEAIHGLYMSTWRIQSCIGSLTSGRFAPLWGGESTLSIHSSCALCRVESECSRNLFLAVSICI